jgi:hypothetical protein
MDIKTGLLAMAAAGMVLGGAALALGTVSAQEPDDTPAATHDGGRREAFIERVAGKLGISSDELKAAMQSAAIDAVNEAEAEGRITSEQATKARERIESGEGFGGLFQRLHERREHRRDLIRRGIIESAATALGMTLDELRTELQSGESIADVAAEQGVSIDAVKSQITSDADAKLAAAVANGKLTQERADDMLAKLNERLDDIVNRSKDTASSP